MATYNGAPYIAEQIQSIQAQSLSRWRLLVRDDGSTDETPAILDRFACTDPRISILDSGFRTGLGPGLNFSAAMDAAVKTDSNLFFISDQDDVWDTDKLASQSGYFPEGGVEDTPILVHSDLAVVDKELNLIHASLIKYMDLLPNPEVPLNYLLARNFVTGCAIACNRRLLEKALPIAEEAIMHDWWLALVAAATGKIQYIGKPLVGYRQHGTNSIGAKGFWHGLNPTNNWIAGWKAGNAEYQATYDQIAAMTEHAARSGDWPESSFAVLNLYRELGSMPIMKRLAAARKLGLRQGNGLLQFVFYMRLLTVQHDSPFRNSENL